VIRLVGTIFCSFFKIGLFTLGGGLAIVSLVQQEMLARGWLTNAEFLDILGIAQMTPGPISVLGVHFGGGWFNRNRERPVVRRVFAILRPLVAGFVTAAGVTLTLEVFPHLAFGVRECVNAGVFAVTAALVLTKRFSPLWGLLLGAVIGIVLP